LAGSKLDCIIVAVQYTYENGGGNSINCPNAIHFYAATVKNINTKGFFIEKIASNDGTLLRDDESFILKKE
jgi:hypothetical protein